MTNTQTDNDTLILWSWSLTTNSRCSSHMAVTGNSIVVTFEDHTCIVSLAAGNCVMFISLFWLWKYHFHIPKHIFQVLSPYNGKIVCLKVAVHLRLLCVSWLWLTENDINDECVVIGCYYCVRNCRRTSWLVLNMICCGVIGCCCCVRSNKALWLVVSGVPMCDWLLLLWEVKQSTVDW